MSYPSRRRLLTAVVGPSALALAVSGLAIGAQAPVSLARSAPTGQDCLAAVGSGPADQARQRVFTAAAETYRVPASLLLGVSYMQSRWDDHGRFSSTSGGYGPMHLTDVDTDAVSGGKGERSRAVSDGPEALHTVDAAADATALAQSRLRSDDAANICGGAAVLASYQRELGRPVGERTSISAWQGAVRKYNAAADPAGFVERVYATIKAGESRTTNDGQRVDLAAHPALRVPAAPDQGMSTADAENVDCPNWLMCEWIPAPYEWYGEPNPYAYGNHDLADRPNTMDIEYILIHDTETSYDGTIRLVTNPRYVSWQYTLRSSDGHIAQHIAPENVAWHAGNWYVNMHSIGLEHEGFAAQGAQWYTEAMYQTSADLVAYLAAEHDVPLDRAHIIGHDQVPGIAPAYVRGMHWDPGPYWDWEHYMDLIGAPIKPDRRSRSDVWTVTPGFEDNQQVVTHCDSSGTCRPQGTNFVYVHTEPDASSPLVKDIGLRPDGSNSTRHVSDIGARLAAGQKVVVNDRIGDWIGVWYLGQQGWVYSPKSDPVVLPSDGPTVTPKPGAETIPVYGRAYPEASAYPAEIPYQTVIPMQYTIKAGQEYSLADAEIQTDYYYSKTYDYGPEVAMDDTQVVGETKYYQIWFGHRFYYVQADDVVVSE